MLRCVSQMCCLGGRRALQKLRTEHIESRHASEIVGIFTRSPPACFLPLLDAWLEELRI